MMIRASPGALVRAGTAAAILLSAAPLAAQRADLRREATAGSEAERYLRVLQVAGKAPLYPWSLRGFSAREVERLLPADSAHPWADRLPAAPRPRSGAALLRPRLEGAFNSAFPTDEDDGAVWTGRGVTGVASAGFTAWAGPLSLRVEPLAFWAQNRGFELMDNGRTGPLAYGDGDNPASIDRPQRFGEDAYARIDPGQSTLRLEGLGLALAASTANQVWGPGEDLPLVLGTRAGGFPHLSLGTARPVNVGVGRVHVRTTWGRLEQSAFSAADDSASVRFMTGLVAVFTPAGLPGLEIGGTRFFHTRWPEGGPSLADFAEPFQPFLKVDLPKTGVGPDSVSSSDNQIASVFARWVLPRSEFEVWGEYVRDDHNWDLRDLILQPDHSASYMLGARKVWAGNARLVSLRAELSASQQSHLQTVRGEGRLYTHDWMRQGHTHRGQILGSPAAYGGGGSVVAMDAYQPWGRWTVEWMRSRVRGPMPGATTAADSARVDVVHSLAGEAVLLRGGVDLTLRLRGDYEVDRHYRGDAFNLSAALGVRLGF